MKTRSNKRKITRRSLLKGIGIASGGLAIAYYFGRGLVPIIPTLETPDFNNGVAWISVRPDGKIRMFCPTLEMGQNSSLGLAQIVAEELLVEAANIEVQFPSTSEVPSLRFTTGSMGIVSHARPVAEAAARLREELRRRAAVKLDVDVSLLQDGFGGFLLSDGSTIGFQEIVDGTDLVLDADAVDAAQVYTFDDRREHRQVGRTGSPIQAKNIVCGEPVYSGDIRRPGMLYGRAVQAPAPNAQIVEVDFGDASDMAGVVSVIDLRAQNLVGIVAETQSRLNLAMEEVKVVWDSPPKFTSEDIMAMVDVDRALSNGTLEHTLEDSGLVDDGSWEFDMRFDQGPLHHAAQELRCAVAEFAERDGLETVEIWTGSQDIFINHKKVAADLGFSSEQITIHNLRMGGAFGGRVLYDVVREAVFFAREVGRPVKVEWSRRDEFLADRMRPPSTHRVRARVDGNGQITDWWHACKSGYVLLTEMVAPEPTLSVARFFLHDRGSARGLIAPYRSIRRRIELGEVALPFHVGEWRSLGAAPNNFAIESTVDEIAQQLETDPVDFRLQNLGDEHERLRQVLRRTKQLADQKPRSSEAGFGRGYACGIYDQNTYAAIAVDLLVDVENEDIQVLRCVCVLDAGLAISPDQIKAQIQGSMMMSIGQLMHEQAPIEDGGLSAQNFGDYPTAVMKHLPEFEIEVMSRREVEPAGVGQAPIVAQVPALANAFRDATGHRLFTLPVDFETLNQ